MLSYVIPYSESVIPRADVFFWPEESGSESKARARFLAEFTVSLRGACPELLRYAQDRSKWSERAQSDSKRSESAQSKLREEEESPHWARGNLRLDRPFGRSLSAWAENKNVYERNTGILRGVYRERNTGILRCAQNDSERAQNDGE